MKTISLSEKVILALLDCKPIISMNWITEINSTNFTTTYNSLNWNEEWLPELDELLSSPSFLTKNSFFLTQRGVKYLPILYLYFLILQVKRRWVELFNMLMVFINRKRKVA